VFERLQRILRTLVGSSVMSLDAASLDQELKACLKRGRRLVIAASSQMAALMSGSFEIWFALRLFAHPVGAKAAMLLESLTQAARHLAFVVPGGLGIQEAGLMLIGNVVGINGEVALSVSMVKRAREILWGVPALISWQWQEGRHLRHAAKHLPQ
jgi:hypothetical protein